jgi:hypothetical protein
MFSLWLFYIFLNKDHEVYTWLWFTFLLFPIVIIFLCASLTFLQYTLVHSYVVFMPIKLKFQSHLLYNLNPSKC